MYLRDDASALVAEMTRLRHAIHREPEIGLNLPRTQEKVLAALGGLPLEVATGRRLTSVTAVLRGGRPGPAVLLRADMDALPITERSGVEYASRTDTAMHACGHDTHIAMLIGAAHLLAARQAEIPGSVIFMFQPGEEGDRGARYMIDEGVLDAAGARPVAAYALHSISAPLATGVCTTRPGPMLAAADEISVTVRGAGGHGSQPYNARDPIPAACEMITALQTFVTRSFDVFDPVVVTVGTFHAGTASNVIPAEARFGATLRSFSAAARTRVKDGVVSVLRGVAAAHGLEIEHEYGPGYPVTVNDAAEAEFAGAAMADVFGPDRAQTAQNPIMGSEDFSFVLNEVPGAFVLIGACPPGRDPQTAPYNHSAEAVFDDAVLPEGATLYAELALRRLTAG
ncbi:MAG TPA: M20 family metallopeptidase [Streptosporangiaceae bacterium]|nr:M20 family metallopeptidase [Streptosporangiaceae bacterium]